MSKEWSEILSDAGLSAAPGSDGLSHATVSITHETPQLVDLSELKIIHIRGADASAFLQGQFCNDFMQVSSTQAQITGYCTPKGRLLALPTAVGQGDGFLLLVHGSVADAFFKRLSMFVMRSEVSIEFRDDWLCLGLIAGDDGSIGQAEKLILPTPESILNAASSSEDYQLIRWHDDYSSQSRGKAARARYIRIATVADQIALWSACSDMQKASAANWQMADLSAGIPVITQSIVESFVPQMINLQLINALSFTKGCYPGQEIVARMQYLGTLKRHMRLFGFDPAVTVVPSAGSSLAAGDDADAGKVINAVADADGNGLLLAVVKVALNEADFRAGEVILADRSLPYDLPTRALS